MARSRPGRAASVRAGAAVDGPRGELPQASVGETLSTFVSVARPFWTDPQQSGEARWRLAGIVALSLGTTGARCCPRAIVFPLRSSRERLLPACSVGFNFLGRDFFNAISEKHEADFWRLLGTYVVVIAGAIPIFVLRDYFQSLLALKWRGWLTERYVGLYLSDRAFYRVAQEGAIDNPDQRLNSDVGAFTATALGFGMTLFTSAIDLASFSGILLGIYPPLFGVLLVYALGGTALSLKFGAPLVGLNFAQEAREADFRYALVRVRENAESIAFYAGEEAEKRLLMSRFADALNNLKGILLASRNLSFFTSAYRFLISFLPAAVVAPLFFRGEVEFGVINQSSSAFSHILGDVSLVVYQFEALAGFAATIQRVSQFEAALLPPPPGGEAGVGESEGVIVREPMRADDPDHLLLTVDALSLSPPSRGRAASAGGGCGNGNGLGAPLPPPPPLVAGLSFSLAAGQPLLLTGPSGVGKTSLLRALAGLWRGGEGTVRMRGLPQPLQEPPQHEQPPPSDATQPLGAQPPSPAMSGEAADAWDAPFFLPQRPYLPMGTLRQQLLYPRWAHGEPQHMEGAASGDARPPPDDAQMLAALSAVGLSQLALRGQSASPPPLPPSNGSSVAAAPPPLRGLDEPGIDWGLQLSLGEAQRLAFARLLLARPRLALLDEATSALDEAAEARCYEALADAGVTALSVGHRPSLRAFHRHALRLEGGGAWALEEARSGEERAVATV